MAYESERQVAVEAVVAASKLCQVVQARLVAGSTLQKGDKSPVTVADFGAQAVVSHMLAKHFPDQPLIGEEDASDLRDGAQSDLCDKVVSAAQSVISTLSADDVLNAIDRGTHAESKTGLVWTLDPIDGTKGFLRLDQYAVALGLMRNGEVVLGVLGCPNLLLDSDNPEGARGAVFVAVKDEGTFMRSLDDATETKVGVSGVDQTSDARFCESVEKAHSSQSHSALVAEKLGITAPPFRIDSQCKYAAVARGDAAIYLRLPTRKDYVEKIWDHAAGYLVVTEAGGAVSDIHGHALDFSHGRRLEKNKGVIVTNGRFHAEVLSAVGEVLGL
jgi:3'(2'), 5'-bisphosphate nucleotidase